MKKGLVSGLFLAVSLSLFLPGCVSVPYINPPRTEDVSLAFNISVSSEPTDAEIYINNILYGRTPQEALPLAITCTNHKDWLEETFKVQGQYVLMVSKKGFRKEAKPLEFSYAWSGANNEEYRPYLKEKKFHFKLEKEE
ncbi:MAG: PEGA domain-containing protein [Candidatus Omnitrophica bacterium]|nr:PEGA domain-containing protein [Candidatus Omnitrophota bacterium]